MCYRARPESCRTRISWCLRRKYESGPNWSSGKRLFQLLESYEVALRQVVAYFPGSKVFGAVGWMCFVGPRQRRQARRNGAEQSTGQDKGMKTSMLPAPLQIQGPEGFVITRPISSDAILGEISQSSIS